MFKTRSRPSSRMTVGIIISLTEEIRLHEAGAVVRLTPEHKLIISLIEEGAPVVDLGCGEGDLLLALSLLKKVRPEGIELSEACIQACVARSFQRSSWRSGRRIGGIS